MKVKIELSDDYKGCVELEEFLRSLPCSFDNQGEKLFENRRNTVKVFAIKQGDSVLERVVVKRFTPTNIFQQIGQSLFSPSKARRAFYNGIGMRARGFHTPAPMAFAEEVGFALVSRCYYVSAFAEGEQLEHDRICSDEALIEGFGTFLQNLHQNRIIHNDMNFSNVMIVTDGGKTKFSVIDINRMRIYDKHETLSLKKRANDLVRCTGDLDLYRKIAIAYATMEGGDVRATTSRLIEMKTKHDRAWKRRKGLSRKIKKLFRME